MLSDQAVSVVVIQKGEDVTVRLSRVPVMDEYLVIGGDRETVQVRRVAHLAQRNEDERPPAAAALVWVEKADLPL
jgi:hypothetical protein